MKSKNATLRINAKCSDLWYHEVVGANGQVLSSYDGYVPSFMPNGGGDYVELEIDPYTGMIKNWKKWKKARKVKSS